MEKEQQRNEALPFGEGQKMKSQWVETNADGHKIEAMSRPLPRKDVSRGTSGVDGK